MLTEERMLSQDSRIAQDEPSDDLLIADYLLLDPAGRPLAVVEAKRSSRSPLEGERQAAEYADRIRATHGVDPFVFLANGDETWFWHRSLYPPQRVSGFFTLEDLRRLQFLDRHHQPLTGAEPLLTIIDRAYQIESAKTIAERIAAAEREFLLVLATGTGKTRVAIAIVELLQRLNWVQRVLFLADRRELVKQALGAFKECLPDMPRAWIEGGTIDHEARIHAATYPGMMGICQKLSPGYYDLIIADESHRSIYNRYQAIFQRFYSIRLGLTATPTDFIDHNTFRLFGCADDVPTFHYGYDAAKSDRYLVPYRIHSARTSFQIDGLAPGDLPPEMRGQVEQQGADPDDFSFEGTDLERRVTNTGTNDAIVREFMDHSIKSAGGTLPAKTIIFAVSHRHALEIYQSFNRLYPDLQRRGMAKVIDSHMEMADRTLDDFKTREMPRVAISVDMLDTGIDVPSICNLVFARPVFSKVKFWQMIGRGTRPWTDPEDQQPKTEFLIIDHWNNFEYFRLNADGREPSATEPLPVRLFRQRLEKLQILSGREESARASAVITVLQEALGALPLENVSVAPHAAEIRTLVAGTDAWEILHDQRVTHLAHVIAPLLAFADGAGYPELQFRNLCEQLSLAWLRADAGEIESLHGVIVENLALLPASLPEIRPHAQSLTWMQTPAFWEHLDYDRIQQLQDIFAPLMRFRSRRDAGPFVRISLPDRIAERRWITFGPGGEGAFAENYRAQVEARVRDLLRDHPLLDRLQTGEPLTEDDLAAIGQLFTGPDLFITEASLREAFHQPHASLDDFLRHILDIARLPSREEQISRAFDEWVRTHPGLTATQLMFLRTLRQAVIQQAEVTTLDSLRQPPFNVIGDPENLFSSELLADILALAARLPAA